MQFHSRNRTPLCAFASQMRGFCPNQIPANSATGALFKLSTVDPFTSPVFDDTPYPAEVLGMRCCSVGSKRVTV